MRNFQQWCMRRRFPRCCRLLRPDIVHFHFTCLGTEIFLPELTLSDTLSSNPKSSRSVDLQFSHTTAILSSLRDCSLFIVQGETEEKLYKFFRCPPLKTSKIFKAPPPQQAKQEHKCWSPPPLALYLYFEKQKL